MQAGIWEMPSSRGVSRRRLSCWLSTAFVGHVCLILMPALSAARLHVATNPTPAVHDAAHRLFRTTPENTFASSPKPSTRSKSQKAAPRQKGPRKVSCSDTRLVSCPWHHVFIFLFITRCGSTFFPGRSPQAAPPMRAFGVLDLCFLR